MHALTPIDCVDTRLDRQDYYTWATHELAMTDGKLKINLKRVDTVACDAAFGSIRLLI